MKDADVVGPAIWPEPAPKPNAAPEDDFTDFLDHIPQPSPLTPQDQHLYALSLAADRRRFQAWIEISKGFSKPWPPDLCELDAALHYRYQGSFEEHIVPSVRAWSRRWGVSAYRVNKVLDAVLP